MTRIVKTFHLLLLLVVRFSCQAHKVVRIPPSSIFKSIMVKQKIHPSIKVGMKRKIELSESLPKKCDAVIKTKVPLKADLIVSLKELQAKYDALKQENNINIKSLEAHEMTNDKNREEIKQLKEKVEQLEKKETSSDNRGFNLKCEECDFEAVNKTELSWHLCESHGWPLDRSPEELDLSHGERYCSKCEYQAENGYDMEGHKWGEHDEEDLESLRCNTCDQTFSTLKDLMYHKKEMHGCTWLEQDDYESDQFACNLCDKTFKVLTSLMSHKKQTHEDKLAICWKFTAGKCEFGDDSCWFSHTRNSSSEEHKSFDCSSCGKLFETLSHLLHHKKNEHRASVKACKNAVNETCRFGEKNCWFLHDNEILLEKTQNQSVTDKLFSMMEKFTSKIMILENEMKTYKNK